MPTTNTTAPSVSAALRRAGFRPSSTRNRQGIRVTASPVNGVRVAADLDSDRDAERMSADAQAALTERGYVTERANAVAFYVTGKEARHEAHGRCRRCGAAAHQYPGGWAHVMASTAVTGVRCELDAEATCCPAHAQAVTA